MNSSTFKKGSVISLDYLGMTNGSLRNERDGITYFGFEKIDETNPKKSIDFLIQNKNDSTNMSKYLGRHFQIRFNRNDRKYYIVDLGNGFGTFMKLSQELKLKDNHLINIGNSYIVFSFEDNNYYQNLIFNVYNDTKKYNPIVLKANQTERKFYIGRDGNCDVVIEDALLSRIHCTVFYSDINGWSIVDGKGGNKEESTSTNGTWIYIIEEVEINDGMVFKGNQNLYLCNYV